MMAPVGRLSFLPIFVITLVVRNSFVLGSASTSRNPYQVLGVSPRSSDDEVRKAYRKLCLKYHPDKHSQDRPRLRKKSERLFKEVQDAYSQIKGGDGIPTGTTAHFTDEQSTFEQAFRQFQQQQHSSFHNSRPYQVFSFHQLFSSPPTVLFPVASLGKTVYVQKVPVPLQDLYRGVPHKEFPLQISWWRRHVAAWRGGSATWLLYQSFLYAVPVLRWSRIAAGLVAALLFHHRLPRVTRTMFHTDIKAGYKEGTRLTFFANDSKTTQAVFVLVEEPHPVYCRQGDDLLVTKYISRQEMIEGTTVVVEPLDPDAEDVIHVEVTPGTTNRHLVTLSGRGWPNRRTGRRGKLLVNIVVEGTKEDEAFWER